MIDKSVFVSIIIPCRNEEKFIGKCLDYLGYKIGNFPISERASKEVLSLPIFPELKKVEQEEIIGKIKDFVKSEGSKNE